ncbi:hypothetical protein Syun_019948 [Stephania yunnanensis]|uniref:Uncharacterized protein n=1 Tax=Stephania yunnanensis TaxID=152371 RepID=A0AAP0IV26_9MAGN
MARGDMIVMIIMCTALFVLAMALVNVEAATVTVFEDDNSCNAIPVLDDVEPLPCGSCQNVELGKSFVFNSDDSTGAMLHAGKDCKDAVRATKLNSTDDGECYSVPASLGTLTIACDRSIVGSAYGLYPSLREDGFVGSRGDGGTPITDRESSCVGVRRTCARPSVIVSRAVTSYLRRSPVGGLRRLVLGRGAQKRRAVLGPPRYGEATGSIMPVAGVQPKGLSPERRRGGHGSEQGRQHDVTVQTPVHEFDDSGSKAMPRKRLVKKSGDRERTPDFGIEDEEPAFIRNEFASEPPSSQKRKGSKEDGFRKKEKKLKGDKKFDKGGKMSSKGGSLSAICPGRDREMKELWDTVAGADSEDDQKGVRTMDDDNFIDDTWSGSGGPTGGDNEGFIGDAPRLEKGHGTRDEVDTARAIIGQAYAAITNSKEILLAAIQTESRHGVKINVKHLVPYYGDTSDDDNSRANSVHPGENDEVQELACKFLIGDPGVWVYWKRRGDHDTQLGCDYDVFRRNSIVSPSETAILLF